MSALQGIVRRVILAEAVSAPGLTRMTDRDLALAYFMAQLMPDKYGPDSRIREYVRIRDNGSVKLITDPTAKTKQTYDQLVSDLGHPTKSPEKVRKVLREKSPNRYMSTGISKKAKWPFSAMDFEDSAYRPEIFNNDVLTAILSARPIGSKMTASRTARREEEETETESGLPEVFAGLVTDVRSALRAFGDFDIDLSRNVEAALTALDGVQDAILSQLSLDIPEEGDDEGDFPELINIGARSAGVTGLRESLDDLDADPPQVDVAARGGENIDDITDAASGAKDQTQPDNNPDIADEDEIDEMLGRLDRGIADLSEKIDDNENLFRDEGLEAKNAMLALEDEVELLRQAVFSR